MKQATDRETPRKYYAGENDAHNVLIAEGYTYNARDRFEYTSRDGLVSAQVRYNAQGYFILYVA